MLLVASLAANAKGGIPLLFQYGDDIIGVEDLPENEMFTLTDENGKSYHADLGILHEQFSILWIPIVNYGTEKYVLYTKGKNFCAGLDETEMQLIKAVIDKNNLPEQPELPFWNAWGGKILLIILIGVYFFIKIKLGGNEEETEKEQ